VNRWLTALFMVAGLAVLAGQVRADTPPVEVEALFKDGAVVSIDGERKTLRVGQSHGGVTLLSAYSRTATFEVDGRQLVLGLSRRIGTNFQEPVKPVVTIERNAQLQYQTTASINGRQVQVMVDTGANVVALSSQQAGNMGIDYRTGIPARVETASGVVNAWVVTLRSVSVGNIRVQNVQASVVEGRFPATILLGMSFLQHVDLSENNGVLSLSRAW
jgi:aspartyl protease family protein